MNQDFDRKVILVLGDRIGYGLERIGLDVLHLRQGHLGCGRVERHDDHVVERIRSELEAVIRELLTALIIDDDIIEGSDIRFDALEGNRVHVVRLILRPYIYEYGIADLRLLSNLVIIPGDRRYVRNRQTEVQFHFVVITLGIEVLKRYLVDINHLQRSIRREFNRVVDGIGTGRVVLRTHSQDVLVTERLAFVVIRYIRGIHHLVILTLEPLHDRRTTVKFGYLLRSEGIVVLLLRTGEAS